MVRRVARGYEVAVGTHREGPRASSPRVIAPSRGCTELLDDHVVRAFRVDRRVSRVFLRVSVV